MLQFSPFRTLLILLVSLAGIIFTLPNFVSQQTVAALPDWMPKQQIVLGLDLQGGSHLLLQVNREEIVTERVKELRREARSLLANDNGIGHLIQTDGTTLTIELTDATQFETAKTALQALDIPLATTLGGIGGVTEIVIGEHS